MNPSIKRAVLGIPHDAWQHISYPTAVPDPETGDVRRVRDLAKPAVVGEQDELFPVWRYHPFFTDQPAATLRAER